MNKAGLTQVGIGTSIAELSFAEANQIPEQLYQELEVRIEFAEKLIDSLREAVLVLSADLKVANANLSFYQLFQVTPEETLGKHVYSLGNGEWDIPRLRLLLEDILPKHHFFDDFEVEHAFKTLGWRRMSLNARQLDRAPLILLTIRDLTDTVLGRRALNDNEQRFRALVEASSDVIYRMSPDWSEMRQLVGRDFIADTQAPSRSWLQKYIPPDDQAEVTAAIAEAIRTKSVFERVHRVVRLNGDLAWTFSRAVPILDKAGEVTEWFGMAKDITARKDAESALRESEARLRSFFENAAIGAAQINAQGRFIEVNDRLCQITGYTRDELLTTGPRELIAPDEVVTNRKRIEDFFHPNTCYLFYEKRYVHKDGHLIWVRVTVAPVFNEQGAASTKAAFIEDITARKQVEAERERLLEKIHTERDLLQAVMNGAGKAHLVFLDRDFNFVHVNETYAATCGYRPADMIGRNHFALYPNAETEAIFRRVRDTGQAFEVHDRPFAFPEEPERGITYWDWTLTPVKNADGQVSGLILSLFETTARVSAEAELRDLNATLEHKVAERTADLEAQIEQRIGAEAALLASEAQLRTIIQQAPIGISRANPADGCLLAVNPAYCAIVGYKEKELIGQPVASITHPDDQEADQEGLRRLVAGEIDNYVREKRYVRKDGGVIWVGVNASLVRDADGRPLYTVAMITDITERRRLEQKLEDDRDFMDAVLDTQAALVLVVDAEGRLIRFNQACEALTGYDFSELRGGTDWWKLVPEEERADIEKRLLRGFGDTNFFEHENHLLCRDGKPRLIHWRNAALLDQNGNLRYVIGTGIDVTDERRLSHEAGERLEELSWLQRQQTASEFAAMIAHELNQPLAAMSGYADASRMLIKQPLIDRESVEDNLVRISRECMRASETIRRLRAFIRRGETSTESFQVNAAVEAAIDLIRPALRRNGIRLETNLDASLPPVRGVAIYIQQTLLNLLNNGIEAIRDADIRDGLIQVCTNRRDGMARVSISDNGPGIDPDNCAYVFEPMRTTKPYGLGMGLRISRSLIEAMNGRLWFESGEAGTTFHFELPIVS